ncbi:MAG: Dabb family protein [Adhaeribacter sp.]
MFVHHVFFWLKPSNTAEENQKFEKSVSSLKTIKSVQQVDIGKPALTDRPVIDTTYSYSLLLIFDSLEQHDQYQVDPTHLQFVADCSTLWDRVLIYDSETI